MGFLWGSRWDNAQKGSVQALLTWVITLSDIRHRAGTDFPEYSTKWEEDITPSDHTLRLLSLDQFSSFTQSCPTLCDPMNCSMPGLPVHHQLPESTQTHAHRVGDAIQPSHPLSSHSPPALNLSQHLGLFKWVSSLHEVAKVLEFQLQHQSFQWTLGLISFRMDWLDLFAVQGLSRIWIGMLNVSQEIEEYTQTHIILS